jgi:cytochrome c-type biogenesis protein CcmH
MVALIYGGFALVLLAVLVMIVTPIIRTRELSLKQRYEVAGTVFVFFFAAAYGIYFYTGAPQVVTFTAERELEMARLRQAISQHSEIVKQSPDRVESWAVLGDSFLKTGQFKGAVNAFKQAVKLSGGQPQMILGLANAQIAEAGGKVTDEAKKGIEMVQLQDPQNPEAKYLMAVRKLQDGRTEEAMKEMRALYYSLPGDSELKAHIDEQIGRNVK